MDRVSVRSFRAPDLAERAIKDLARSRLDTGRAVVFQPLGGRFLEARDDAARIVALLREDAFHAENGHFARMTMRVDPQLADRLAGLEPRAVERRLEDATRDVVLRELPRAQGVYLARFEPAARGLEPVAHVHLSCRTADGGPAPTLSREDARRFDAAWSREVEKAFGIARGVERDRDRPSALDPEAERLRQEWARASVRLFAAYTERLHGKATHHELAEALKHARSTRAAWSRAAGPPVDLRDVEGRQVFDVVRLRIEGGARFLRGPLEAHRRTVLETAAARAAQLPDDRDHQRLAVVAWPANRDLQAAVYFNQRSRPERSPESLDPERMRAALEARLGDEIRRFAPGLDPTAEARAHELGRVEARLPERAPARERAAAVPVPGRDAVLQHGVPAMVVTLEREHVREADAAALAGRTDEREALVRLHPPERDWSQERVFAIRVRIPTGAEQLDALGLSAEDTARIVQRAVDRAYPFLQQEGIRDSFLYSVHGRALDVQVIVPERLGWTPQQLRSPQFQQRFMTGFHQALAQVGPTRIGPDRQQMLPGFVRGVAAVRQAPQMLRRAEQDPERAAKDLARAVFSKLSEALPKPFRLMRDLGRTVSRFVPRG